MSRESSFVGEGRKGAKELQASGGVCREKHVQKQPAEKRRENLDRQKITRAASDPLRSIPGQSAPRHDHVHMRMVDESGAPAVQHRDEADACAEMLGIGGDPESNLGRSL